MSGKNIWGSKNLQKKLGAKIILGPENFLKKILGKKNFIWKFWVGKNFRFEKIWVQIFFGSNKISGLKALSPNKILYMKNIFSSKNFGFEEVLSKNILVHKNLDPKKIGSKKFGQNRASNSWDNAYLDEWIRTPGAGPSCFFWPKSQLIY